MILVPRQLRRSDFPSSVPYYGGRLTPGQIAGLQRPPAAPPAAPLPAPLPPPPPPPPSPSPEDTARRLAMLDDLRADGVVSAAEYDELRGRVVGEA